jgi:hypothetical protein
MVASIGPPLRIVLVAGLLAAAGFAAFALLAGRTQDAEPATAEAVPGPPVQAPRPPAPARTAKTRKAESAGTRLPAPIQRALRRHRVVVVAVYMPGAAVDAVVRAEARAGAVRGRAGFVAVSAASERLVRPLVARAGLLPEPAVVILRRPGVAVATLGVADSGTVAEAALQARKR